VAAPAAQPVSAEAPAPAPAPGAPPPANAPPQPQALQSTPDMSASYAQLANPPNLMSLYLQLDQRNRASEHINHGLALIASHFSSPEMANTIMQSAGGGPDAGQQVSNLMSLYQTQQQMGAQQQLLGQASEIAQKTGLPEATVRAQILAGRGNELVSSMMPTTEQRNVQWEHDQFIKGGGDEATWQRDYLPNIITRGMAGASDPMWQVYRQERAHAQETDPNAPFPNYADWTSQRQAKANEDLQVRQAQTQATKDRPNYDLALGDLRTRAAAITDPANKADLEAISKLPSAAIARVLEPGPFSDVAQFVQSKTGYGITPQQVDLIRSLHELSTSNLHDLAASNPGLAQDLLPLGQNLAGLGRFDVGVEGLTKNANAFIGNIDKARANAWGKTGDLANMPDELRLSMDPSYGWGGSNFHGAGQPMTKAEIADAQDDMKTEKKADVVRYWRAKGKITTPIE
jgi:hypothetical protein